MKLKIIFIFGRIWTAVMNISYRTRQRESIWNFLQENKDRHVMVDDVVDYLKSQGNGVGKSTVYRYLEKLVEEGKVRKYFLEEGAGACFQLAGGDESCCKHYHLKCVRCGALLHVECSFLDQVHAHILQQHQFQIDSRKTVLYGLCEQCRETGEKENRDED